MYEQKEKPLSLVFEEPSADVARLMRYTEGPFQLDEAAKRLDSAAEAPENVRH